MADDDASKVVPQLHTGEMAKAPSDVDEPSTRTRMARLREWGDQRPAWVQWTAVAAVFLILSLVLAARFMPAKTALSRADEWVYVDAVDKAAHGEITRTGATIDDYALDLIACRGVELLGQMGDRCGTTYEASDFPYNGVTSADIHSPVYYFGTAWLARVIQSVTPLDSLLLAARFTSVLWLGLGLTALVGLARTLGASRLASAAVGLLVLASPSVRWTNLYVTPDALNLLAGSLVTIAAVKYARRQWSPWILIGLSAAVTAVKAQNVIAVGLAALFLVLYAVTVSGGRSWRGIGRHLAVSAGALGAAVAVQLGYTVLRAHWAVGPPPVLDPAGPMRMAEMLNQSRSFLMAVSLGPDAAYPPALAYTPPAIPATFISWLLAGGLVAGALFAHLDDLQTRLAQGTALAFLLAGPAIYTMIQLTTGRGFSLPDRYGMVMLPAMAAVTAILARRRWVQILVIGLAVLAFAEAMVTLRMV